MRKQVIAIGAAALVGLLLVPLASTGAAAPETGTAAADSVLVRVRSGLGTISLVRDHAEAVLGGKAYATASLVTGSADDKTVGSAERNTTKRGRAEEATVGAKAYKIGDLVSLGLDAGTISTELNDLARAKVSASLGDVSMLGGFARLQAGSSVSETTVTSDASSVTRTIRLGELRALAIGDLLAAIGASPFDLTCQAIADLGAIVGVDTADACPALGTAEDAVDAAVAEINRLEAQLIALREQARKDVAALNAERSKTVSERKSLVASRDAAVEQQEDLAAQGGTQSRSGLEAQKTSLTSQRNTVAAMCTGVPLLDQAACAVTRDAQLTAIDGSIAAVDAALAIVAAYEAVTLQIAGIKAEIAVTNATLDAIDRDIDKANAKADSLGQTLDAILALDAQNTTTCKAVSDVLDAAAGTDGGLDDARDTVDGACAELAGLVQALIDTPLIRMDGVVISITTIAREGKPVVKVSGTIGELRVGTLDPAAVDLSVIGKAVSTVESLVAEVLADVSAALDIDLPVPTFEFLAKETSKGQREDGTWYAQGTVTALRIHLPSARISLPAVDPLGVLTDTVTIPVLPDASPASYRATASSVKTPTVSFDLAEFSAASTHRGTASVKGKHGDKTSSSLSGRGALPVTGVGAGVAAPALIALAFAARRFVLRTK